MSGGRVAVVTGAARGLGELIALRLAGKGFRLALVGLEPDELARVADKCGNGAAHWKADVTDDVAMAAVAAEIVEQFGRVDIVVANAGIATGGPVELSDPATFNRVIQVNLLGSATTARAFLPALRANKGYFFQVASLAALTAAPMMAAYCASKAGVEAFAHSLRAEVARFGVGVGVGYLSWTDTDMVRGADEDKALGELRARMPWPTGKTYPLEPTVDRLVAGILRRRPQVYGQWWLPGLRYMRPLIPGIVTSQAAKMLAGFDEKWQAAGGRSRLVGAGGAADEKR
ncbi:SDR family oxidoreductase [Actinocorallia sp. A-T 12471]|uniref:SDR family oxidoreductase n=1 Tax=Actinocorallia sp. A-T 12471 TaxID=3089813 RepID=UPI0029D40C70|nr:SDR family oxidoreductase [Actinocorallia sp. A-T 12471]MDX6739986.1 SDR family oxidoreductase [Actinocorallia sp. A-T 12471]